MKKELEKDGIKWDELVHCKHAAQFHKILMRTKDELCTEEFETCLLSLDTVSDYDNIELNQTDFLEMINSDMVCHTLDELFEKIRKGRQIDQVCICGSSIRQKIVKDHLIDLVKNNKTRLSEVLNIDEAVVRGLVLSQLTPEDKEVPYTYIKMNATEVYYDLDSQCIKAMANVDENVDTLVHKEYMDKYEEFEAERKLVEEASQEYGKEIEKAKELLNELVVVYGSDE